MVLGRKEIKVQRELVTDGEHRVEFTILHDVQHVGLMKSSAVLLVDAENLRTRVTVVSFYGLVQREFFVSIDQAVNIYVLI